MVLDVMNYFPETIKKEILKYTQIKDNIEEIRLRINQKLTIKNENGLECLEHKVTKNEIEETFENICEKSIYSYIKQISEGFITVKGGNRVGITGTCVIENGQVKNINDISSLNFRIARQIKDVSDPLLKYVIDIENKTIFNTMIVSPPGGGKTTILRDMARLLSSGYAGKYKKISVIDERKELSSGFDIGINTDVISSYKKAKGIELAVRTLSPELIVCDEIGNSDEVEAIKFGFSSGTSFILSIHLKSINDLMRNQIAIQLISTREFSHIVFLHGIDEGFDIIDLTEDEYENGRNSNDIRNIYTPFSEYV